jgi:hypothetical protein
MAKWNKVTVSNLSDYTREQAEEKGEAFLKAWKIHHEEEQKAKVKEVLKLIAEET